MKFRDEANVFIKAGDGGSGKVGWRREKYIPQGGPDGGNGGNGGAVIFQADNGTNTLTDFYYNPKVIAEDGEDGGGAICDGKDGSDIIIKVPVGTQVFFQEQLVADLTVNGARWIAARGGRGGKGNNFFKTATNRAPKYSQPGMKGETFDFHLVLKSVADVGLVGLPNVGKSTLISVISNAKPLIADYAFTTITPNLGVVELDSHRRFVIADIPGLIEQAHIGKGLGITFLKHIERTTVLAQFIDPTTDFEGARKDLDELENISDQELSDIVTRQFELIENELLNFSNDLLKLPRVVIFTKADLPIAERALRLTAKYFKKRNLSTHLISSVNNTGLDGLKSELWQLVRETKVDSID
ncbi:MAG: GTPase ObgE [Proteobacteria bacterium]|nr:GTPase ObgE [Pseudomonadota bacterium]